MRTIKFRGKSVKTGQWLHGSHILNRGYNFIADDSIVTPQKTWEDFEIIPETLGQFTGLRDKNGKDIYEGDLVQHDCDGIKSTPLAVEFRHGGFGYVYSDGFYLFGGNTNFTFNPLDNDSSFEVVGNIHDKSNDINNTEQ